MRILVVDDSTTMRRILKNALKLIGEEDIVEASNGVEAMDKMAGVELVFTDWNMPEMNGLSFVKWLRSQAVFAKVPIIMVTTEGAKDDLMSAIKAGVNQYIHKPFTAEIIKEKVQAVFS